MAMDSEAVLDELNLEERLAEGEMDFDAWTALISDVEKRYPDNIHKISSVYEPFLSHYPLCYGYWRKYANHKAQLCTLDEVVEVFERSVECAAYSVDIWVGYCIFGISCFEDPLDVSRLFRRSLSYIGKDYTCNDIWDLYIEHEFSQQNWRSLAHIYIQILNFPTKKLHHYYDSFKKLVATWEADLESQEISGEVHSESEFNAEATTYNYHEICCIIDNLLSPSTRAEGLEKYSSFGEKLYRRASKLEAEICEFEKNIRRPYFHVKPLDCHQLENWHQYLDFGEKKRDFDWVVKLYERCLIPCANYPEFWMRYVEFAEAKGGREIANYALERATQIFLKFVPAIHLINAGFKEQIGDIDGARATFIQLQGDLGFYSLDNILRRANMEKRLGNYVAASDVYKEAIKVAADRNLDSLPLLYVHFSRLQYAMTNDVNATRDILLDGIHRLPNCRLLLEELIKFAMIHGAQLLNIVESVVSDALSSMSGATLRLSAADQEYLSCLFLEFIDLYGTIHDSRRAWYHHTKLFPHVLRSTSSFNQPTRSGAMQKIIAGGDLVDGSSHLIEPPTEMGKLLLTSNRDQPEAADNNLNVPEPDAVDASNLYAADICKGDAAELACNVDAVEGDEPSTLDATQKEQEGKQGSDREVQLPSLDILSLNPEDDKVTLSPSRESVVLPEHSRGNNNIVEVVPSMSSPLPIQTKSFSPRLGKSASPTPTNQSPVSTPDHLQFGGPSNRGSSQERWRYSGRPDMGSSRHHHDHVDEEWSNSPRGHGYFEQSEGWHHGERSASPRCRSSSRHSESLEYRKQSASPMRYGSRPRSKDRHHSPPPRSPRRAFSPAEYDSKSHVGRHRQCQSRYHDSSRVHRGGQRRNHRQLQNMQNQSSAFATQSYVSAPAGQHGSYPQAPMFPSPIQSNEQYPYMLNPQAYAQMWQYYYFQQQQLQQPYQQPQQFAQLQYQQQLQMQQHEMNQQSQKQQLQQQQHPLLLQQLHFQQNLQLLQQQHPDNQQQPQKQMPQNQHRQSEQHTLSQEQLQQLYQQLLLLPQLQQAGQAPTQQEQQQVEHQQQQQEQQLTQQQQEYQQFQQQYALHLHQQQLLQNQIQHYHRFPPHAEELVQDPQSSQLQKVQQLTQKEQPGVEVPHRGQEELLQQPQESHRHWDINEQPEPKETSSSQINSN